MLWFVALMALPVWAQHDFADEAKQRMHLEFDLDSVEAELSGDGFYEPSAPTQLPLEPNSAVESVTVFRDRALVTRVRRVTVSPGSATVVFEGLPHSVRPEGLAGLVLKGSARIVGVELVSSTGEVVEGERLERLRAEALELTHQLGEVRDRIEALLGQRAYLRFTLLAQRGEGAPQPPLSEVRSTLTYVGEAEASLARQLREQEERAKELGEELRPLLVKTKNPVATGRTVRIELEAKEAKLEIGLRYGVTQASWTPSYNARLLQDDTVQLEYFGILRQHTGEVWTDARISMSTANTASGAVLPQIVPWYLGREDGAGFSLDTGSVVATVDRSAGPADSGLLSTDFAATVERSGAVVFAIDGRRTIAGDGSSQRVAVGTQTFRAHVDHASVPKLMPEVHRRASIRYEGEIPLLPGSVSTFVGSDYLGTGATPAVVPGEALRLSFGADDQLKVTRQLLSRRQEFLGAGRKTTRYHFHFQIVVTNYASEVRSVELKDQLPVSELEKVTVKTVRLTAGSREDQQSGPGIRVWDLSVPPGGERVVDLEFTVTAPTEVARQSLRAMELMF